MPLGKKKHQQWSAVSWYQHISTHFNYHLIFPTIQPSHQDVEEPPRFPIREPPSPRKNGHGFRPKGQLETLPTGGSDSSSSESTTSIKVFFTCCGGSSCDYYPPTGKNVHEWMSPAFRDLFFSTGKFKQTPTIKFFQGDVVSFQGSTCDYFVISGAFLGGIYQKYLLDFFSGWNSQEYADFHHQLAGDQQIPPTWMTWRSRMPTPHDSSRVSSRLKRHKDVITYSKQKTRRVNSSTTNTFFLRPPILPKKFWALLWQKYHVKIMFILFVCANSRFPLPHLELGELCPGGLEKTSRTHYQVLGGS